MIVVDHLFWRGRRQRPLALHLTPADKPWPRPGPGGAGRAIFGVWPWLALGLVIVAWELLGINTSPREPHLTITSLAQAYRPLNAVLMLVWILVGIGYGAARARMPADRPPGEAGRSASGTAASHATGLVLIGHWVPLTALLLPRSRGVGVAFWLAAVLAGVLVDLAARRSRGGLSTAEELARMISRPRAAHILIVAGWTFAGWHLFAH